MTTRNYVCPSCGFEVFDEPPGSYAICELCGWEDDHVQLAHPTMSGGANKLSLAEHQVNALRRYPVELMLSAGVRRSSKWRPLEPRDLLNSEQPTDGRSYFESATGEAPPYYWLQHQN